MQKSNVPSRAPRKGLAAKACRSSPPNCTGLKIPTYQVTYKRTWEIMREYGDKANNKAVQFSEDVKNLDLEIEVLIDRVNAKRRDIKAKRQEAIDHFKEADDAEKASKEAGNFSVSNEEGGDSDSD
jgi:outer membrane murein-binding lipoprotein Lpp